MILCKNFERIILTFIFVTDARKGTTQPTARVPDELQCDVQMYVPLLAVNVNCLYNYLFIIYVNEFIHILTSPKIYFS